MNIYHFSDIALLEGEKTSLFSLVSLLNDGLLRVVRVNCEFLITAHSSEFDKCCPDYGRDAASASRDGDGQETGRGEYTQVGQVENVPNATQQR